MLLRPALQTKYAIPPQETVFAVQAILTVQALAKTFKQTQATAGHAALFVQVVHVFQEAVLQHAPLLALLEQKNALEQDTRHVFLAGDAMFGVPQ